MRRVFPRLCGSRTLLLFVVLLYLDCGRTRKMVSFPCPVYGDLTYPLMECKKGHLAPERWGKPSLKTCLAPWTVSLPSVAAVVPGPVCESLTTLSPGIS